MDNKKLKTVINAEEEYLASKSVKVTKKIVKKTIKTSSKVELHEESIKSESGEINTQVKTEIANEELEKVIPDAQEKPINLKNDVVTKKKTKSKKTKKCEHDNQNISVKSSFNKFDALQKRDLIHVCSSDLSKSQEIISNPPDEQQNNCRQCNKPVYKMEEVVVKFKSDKSIYHKSCMRCQNCAKQLKFDNYQSHEGNLYCLVHFKLLFAPKMVEQTEEPKPRKRELIIRESQPAELPPDVVRASEKPDLGLDELHQLNVRSRFQVFENVEQRNQEKEQQRVQQRPTINRSSSILAKYQSNFKDNKDNEGSESDKDNEDDEDADLICSKMSNQRECPIGIGDAMNDIKNRFEKGHSQSKEERREERKQEIQSIRSRLFMGKQAKIKEMYQQAVAESGQGITSVGKTSDVQIVSDATRSIKQKFENGEMFNGKTNNDEQTDQSNGNSSGLTEDADVFESGICKKSRSIFMELDANMAANSNTQQELPKNRLTALSKVPSQNQIGQETCSNQDITDVVKCDVKSEDVKISTAELSQKFKFFETYRPKEGEKRQFRITPPRDGVVNIPSSDSDTDTEQKLNFQDNVLQKTQTTSTMLNKFRELEQNSRKKFEPNEPRPLKCFTPPPEDGRRYTNKYSNSEEEEDEDDEDDDDEDDEEADENVEKRHIYGDEALKEAQNAARAKKLRAKFEKWQANEIKREMDKDYVDIYSEHVSDDTTIENTKTIRERFENMGNIEKNSTVGPRYQINRFV